MANKEKTMTPQERELDLIMGFRQQIMNLSPRAAKKLLAISKQHSISVRKSPKASAYWDEFTDLMEKAAITGNQAYVKQAETLMYGDPEMAESYRWLNESIVRITSNGDVYPWSCISQKDLAMLQSAKAVSDVIAELNKDRIGGRPCSILYLGMFMWLKNERRRLVRLDADCSEMMLNLPDLRMAAGKAAVDWREIPQSSSKLLHQSVMIAWDVEEEVYTLTGVAIENGARRYLFMMWARDQSRAASSHGSFRGAPIETDYNDDQIMAYIRDGKLLDAESTVVTGVTERRSYKDYPIGDRLNQHDFRLRFLLGSIHVLTAMDTHPRFSVLDKAKEYHKGKATLANVRGVNLFDFNGGETKKWCDYYLNLREKKK